jgi:hypothetical protein
MRVTSLRAPTGKATQFVLSYQIKRCKGACIGGEADTKQRTLVVGLASP